LRPGLRHVHFVQSLEPLQGGGLGQAALGLHRAMERSGICSRLASTVAPHSDSTAPADSVIESPRVGPGKIYWSPALRRVAAELVADADVVHGHGFYVGTNYEFGRAARRMEKTLVYHPHGMLEPWILARSPIKKRIAHWWFEDANFAAARLWRALTERERDQIAALGFKAPIVVIPNGIDADEFAKCESLRARSARTRRRVVFLGRLHPKKGLDLLLDAWRRIPAGARSDWELVIYGPDELNHRAELENLVAKYGIGEHVQFGGVVSRPDKPGVLAAADLFVLPSRSEGFSVAILEALAAGLPVIASTSCNFPDLGAKAGGWMCEAAVDSILDALSRAVSSTDQERIQRGAVGREFVRENYDWQKIASRLCEACDSLQAGG